MVTLSSLGLNMSQTLKKRFPNWEGGDTGVFKVPITNDKDNVTKEEQHRPWNQESTSTKRQEVFVKYYRDKPKSALEPSS